MADAQAKEYKAYYNNHTTTLILQYVKAYVP